MGKNILIITSSGGGGLLQSAIAIEEIEKEKDPCQKVQIQKRDLLMDWTGSLFGSFCRNVYNYTQRSGRVFLTNLFVNLNRYLDFIVFIPIFFRCLHTLFKYKIDKVIDNQPLALSAIIKAIRVYNFFSKKSVLMDKVFVDLPTKEYGQMLKGVKNISDKEKKLISIYTIEPLLDNEKSNNEYWMNYCGLPEEKIIYKKDIVRKRFRNIQFHGKGKDDIDITIHAQSEEEINIIQKIMSFGHLQSKKSNLDLNIQLKKEEKVFVILLGSQPSHNAVYTYVLNTIETIKKSSSKKNNYTLFVFADRFKKDKKNLFIQIYEMILKDKDYPANLTIVPMSFQKDDVIAPLFSRCDLSITRSGGHTIMELMVVSKGKKWIHSEAKGISLKEMSLKELLDGIPCWERGNARYLHHKLDGSIVTPNIMQEKLQEII